MHHLAPTGLKAVKTSFTSITVEWDPISDSDRRDSLLGYRIRYAKSGTDDYAFMEVMSRKTEVLISSLKENTEYNICVAGLFNEGIKQGSYSDKIVAKTEKETSKFLMVRFNFYNKFRGVFLKPSCKKLHLSQSQRRVRLKLAELSLSPLAKIQLGWLIRE